jgi:hypothetical protein
VDRPSRVARTDPELAAVAGSLLGRVPELSVTLADAIRSQIDLYRTGDVVTATQLTESLQSNLSFIFRSLGSGEVFDTSEARATGVRRAAAGVPLPPIMDAYRMGTNFVWELLVQAARTSSSLTDASLVAAASDIWLIQDSFTLAMVLGYREESTARVLAHEQERSALVEGLLEGRMTNSTTLWEAAEQLRISPVGWHVVVAAAVPEIGKQAMPGIEGHLLAQGIASVWRLLPYLQVGILDVPSPDRVTRLVTALEARATGAVGISTPYDDLADTARALRFARTAMRSSAEGRARVVLFDTSPLAVTAVSNPDVMQHMAHTVLGALDDLSPDDRTVLLDTLDAWFDAGGSASETAKRLYCHANTVRYRLRRIEEKTGRSLSDPRATTELCIALETERRLPRQPAGPSPDPS